MVSTTNPQATANQTALATNNLRHEHEAALRVLNLMDRAAAYLRDGRKISPFFFEEVVDFLQLFVVCSHHAKEEEILFPFLKEKQINEKNVPLDTIHQEHAEEHRLIAHMETAFQLYRNGQPSGHTLLIETFEHYTHIARRHILKENTLFMLADEKLSLKTQAELKARFTDLECRKLYEGTAERLKELVNELERQAFHWDD
jgi:hemerythrin-like domain-containing protein